MKGFLGQVLVVLLITTLGWAGYGLFFFTRPIEVNQDLNRAKMDLRNIETAVNTFWERQKTLPADLQVLTQRSDDGRPAFLKVEALIDPWRQPYHYDPKQLHPTTGVPLIWTDGTPDRPRKFSNWDLKSR